MLDGLVLESRQLPPVCCACQQTPTPSLSMEFVWLISKSRMFALWWQSLVRVLSYLMKCFVEVLIQLTNFIVEELRNILDKVKLKSTVVIEMVNFTVTWQKMVLISVSESGSWSASLALFCLDEATSSVDTQRDELIQSIIRKEMNHCTVLTSEYCLA